MALADDIEFYGRAVEAEVMTHGEAVTGLVAASRGGLTSAGAADLIANWQTARARYDDLFNAAFHGKAAIENGRRPHPSSRLNP